jgi:polyhydroxyalkanoate synthesis regulator phasin
MIDSLKKALYAGVGLAFLTRDKVEEMGRKLAEEAKLSESDGKKFVDEMFKKSEEAKSSLEKMVSSAVGTAFEKMDIPRRTEVKALEDRVKALESKVAALEAKSPGPA